MKNNMPINPQLSSSGCWKMVNATQNGNSPQEIRQRVAIAEEWITANTIINNDQLNEMMQALACIVRESYQM